MHDANLKENVKSKEILPRNEETCQEKNVLASLLSEAKGNFRASLFSEAKRSMESVLVMYKNADREPPVSVQLLYGNTIEKTGNLKQALTIFNEQYRKHSSMYALIRLGYISINLRDLSLLKQYETACLERLNAPSISLSDKLHLQVILGYYFSYSGQDASLVHEMVEYHKVNSMLLREKLKVEDYIRWLYHLHILQLLNNRCWEERAPFIYEAESLAEQYNQTAILMNIYNLMGIGLLEENVIKAKEYMLKSRDLAIKLGNKQHEMVANTNLLMFYQYLGDTSHAIELAEKAKAIGQAINSNFNEINLVKLYYLIEDYPQALKLIDELKPKMRRINLTITRVDALVFQYKIILRQKDVKKAKRLWPFMEKMCKKHKDKMNLLLLSCQYFVLLNQYDRAISIATKCLEDKNISVEFKIEFSMILLESFIKLDQEEAFLKYVQSFESLVYNKGYFGYLCYVYYYKGLFYLKNKSYIQARVYFIRAKNYFTKVNNLLKRNEMERSIETIDQLLVEIPSNKQLEMMNLLTNNEIMFDSIRLVHSAKYLGDVCKNITKVLHENMVLDDVYFHFIIDRKRTKTLYISDKLQSEETTNEEVDTALRKVIQEKKVSHFKYDNACFHGFPIFSDEKEVISIVLIKNHSVLSEESSYYMEQFLNFISPKIENVVYNELVHVDGLTNLYNRNFFMKRLEEEFQKTADFQNDLSFIMIDIDDFRLVNNQFGHAEGDRILENVAKTIQQSVRSGDIVGRYGGEELIVILPNTYSEIAKGVAHRILNEIRKIHVNESYLLTASIGVSSIDQDNSLTFQELIEKADLSERYAKEQGKNRVCCYWEID
ncbi:diguanylate cyclase (GGDEF)-like protein [Salirhabdus euzebyi]|uniref:Diguanylate cyclase (GGDEF)-like protein n=1 Tax=Salirhabdus euzebyi TaxID=394506 RepID=A0A841QAV9_9BACI|nr:tetratricopeptide repeat-containing diguanylate cyclase [Salirhabdus euzebyi]MBB6455424.1 diguanylate cyclase (GGDEF)-like protein [Salirhabdus euzebyi]